MKVRATTVAPAFSTMMSGICRHRRLAAPVIGLIALLALPCAGDAAVREASTIRRPPNVLYISIDDLNDWIQLLDPSAPIRTPNLERLAARGVTFTRAYCVAPACNPSRTATLIGKRPSTTGVYINNADWRRALPGEVTLLRYFRQHGYRVEGAGKIFHHHAPLYHDDASFDDFSSLAIPPDAPGPMAKINGLDEYGTRNTDWGPWPVNEREHVDVRTVDDVITRLQRLKAGQKPFFLAAGIFRPHMPFYSPPSAYAKHATRDVVMPVLKPGDMDDIPAGREALGSLWFWPRMMESERKKPGSYSDAVRAYQVAASFADEQVGRLIDALDASGHAGNTIVILWSDHGYHLGEKDHWEKFALWEKSTHIPFIMVAPGVARAGGRCDRPVDMTALFPTLVELARLPVKSGLDGRSVVSLLKDPTSAWPYPALSTYLKGNHAVRSEDWRYIRYATGDEELYDERTDPHEWNNLAADPKYQDVIAAHRKWLPAREAESVPGPTRSGAQK